MAITISMMDGVLIGDGGVTADLMSKTTMMTMEQWRVV
jgi:hypothetical protein